jgi:two-component system CheB/CheR fusion protein
MARNGQRLDPAADPRTSGPADADDSVDRESRVVPDGPWIVACGASAGGLEAFSQVLSALPPDLNSAFVLVQHLAPEHESMLASLLQHHTTIPVRDAADGDRLERGRIYVAPPGVVLTLRDGSVQLLPRTSGAHASHPIDHVFRALADMCGERGIAVVLSGSGTDGAAGLRDVRAAGGITMAQEPPTARSDGMPSAAIATGAVDLV